MARSSLAHLSPAQPDSYGGLGVSKSGLETQKAQTQVLAWAWMFFFLFLSFIDLHRFSKLPFLSVLAKFRPGAALVLSFPMNWQLSVLQQRQFSVCSL